jgi:hypothetical protein
MTNAKVVAYSSLAVLLALYMVGAVSVPPGSLRHEVQTLPLWFPIIAGFQKRELAKWAALPCLIFWLTIMIFTGIATETTMPHDGTSVGLRLRLPNHSTSWYSLPQWLNTHPTSSNSPSAEPKSGFVN